MFGLGGSVATVVVAFVLVLGQQAPTGDLPPWAEKGILGLLFLGILTKQIVAGWQYTDIKNENKELKAENIRLVQLTLDTQKATLPAIEASTSAVAEALLEIRALRRERGGGGP